MDSISKANGANPAGEKIIYFLQLLTLNYVIFFTVIITVVIFIFLLSNCHLIKINILQQKEKFLGRQGNVRLIVIPKYLRAKFNH